MRYPLTLLLLVVLFWGTVLSAPAAAVVVFLKNAPEPVMGTLLREDAANIMIEEHLGDGKKRTRSLSRSDIEDIVYTVDKDRLQELKAADPSAYRDYAEELAVKKQDPEARETALRLYLIAASLDRSGLGRSSLLGMINLARGASEERRFRALAYLIDPAHDTSVLTTTNEVKTETPAGGPDGRLKLVAALRNLRQGEKAAASQLLGEAGVQAEFAKYEQFLSQAELTRMLQLSGNELTPEQLRKVLALEIALDTTLGAKSTDLAAPLDQAVSWSTIVVSQGVEPVSGLQLETITEFDPQKSQFDGRNWVEP
ncbi:hypothetical protein [Lignipirellula cremea]|uniref:Uncharacterized protein n=1 Tax=Lignipirellula cremea TaxID=2528010 RepID=A0A518DSW6_9BACT|nr:hypothetical protein [Lignipirellula cremea]QDU94898.1 hypothetical protein Pla8534_27060 [Lignipirellula cremea]